MMKINYNDTIFYYLSENWRQNDKYSGEAFINTSNYVVYVNFKEGELDKTRDASVVDPNGNDKFDGKLCLGKKNLKGFIFSQALKKTIDLDLKLGTIKFN